MSLARFVPLTCATCATDLVGRATDHVLTCAGCGRGWVGSQGGLHPVVLERVESGRQLRADLWLPFWIWSNAAAGAFLSARPLSIARLATAVRSDWHAADTLAPAFAIGSRLPAAAAARIVHLAGTPEPAGEPRLWLVPAESDGTRVRPHHTETALYVDDVVERLVMTRAVADPAPR